MNIFVLGCDDNGLSVIQSLSKDFNNIYSIDSMRNIGTKSKLAKFIKVESPMINEKKFINKLISLGKNNDKGVLIPTGDEWAESIAKNKKKLKNFHICAPNYDLIDTFLNKSKFNNWAKKNNFLTPNIWKLDQANLIKKKNFPVVLKCVSRRRIRNFFSIKPDIEFLDSYRFKVCSCEKELHKHLKIIKKKKIKIFIQELVRGNTSDMYSVCIVAISGRLLGLFYGRKLRGYPSKYGDYTFGKALYVNNKIKEFAKKFVKKSKFNGIAEIEIKRDQINKKKYIIEVNPRTWSWNKAATLSGVNMPLIYCKNLNLTKKKQIICNNRNLYFIKFFKDFEARIYSKKNYYRFPDFQKNFISYLSFVLNKQKVIISEASDETVIKILKFTEFLNKVIKFFFNNLIGKITYVLKKI